MSVINQTLIQISKLVSSFLRKKRYSGPATLFITSHTSIKVFDTVH